MPRRSSNLRSGPARRTPGDAGSVILLVLMTLLLTAFALTKYLEKTAVDLLADAREARAARLRVQAYSALETTLGVLQEFIAADGALHSATEGWGKPLEFAGYAPPDGLTVEATTEDESGKISLRHADYQTLRDLFVLLGQKQPDAERLADALLVWMQPGYDPVNSFSARATDYERAAVPHDPPGRSLHSFSELASIQLVRDTLYHADGRPNDLWRSFVDSVSLFDFAQPNVNNGRETTLAAVGSYDAASVKLVGDYLGGLGSYSRQGPAYFHNAQEVAGLVGPGTAGAKLGTEVRCLRVTITVREGQASYRLSAVIAPPGGAALPPANPPTAASAATTDAASTEDNATAAAGSAPATTTTTPPATSGSQTQPALNYPFTLLEIRENDEIVETAPPLQPAPP
jgi:Type II secretion system (T2SS), protein K